MKNITLAFLYNVRHQYPDLKNRYLQFEADFDDQATIDKIIWYLRKVVKRVIPIEANEKAYLELYEKRKKIDLVFNYSEGIFGKDRYAQIPAMLEMLQLPFTGSSPLTQSLVLRKPKMKEILMAYKIPTLPFQLFKNGNEKLNSDLKFPLIVKPCARGSSAGIMNSSIVNDLKSLKTRINWIIKTFNEPALVEPLLAGREFSVPLIGNPPRVLPFVEPNHKLLPKEYLPIDSFEVKWFVEEQAETNHLTCPAKVDQKLKDRVSEICLAAWKALEINDWCRMDVRCDMKNQPYILDVNSPPGLMPPEISVTSYLPLSARSASISFQELLDLVISTAMKRI